MKNMAMKEKPMPMKDKPEVRYPSFSISSKLIPEVEDYKMGEKVEMKIVCKVCGLHEGYDDKTEIKADLDMIKAEVMNLTDDRKEANRKGLSMKDYMDLKKKSEKTA